MPLKHILKNKLLLQKHFNLQEISIDDWPFWMFEENIKIANEIIDEENKNRKKEEEAYKKNTPNINPRSILKEASDIVKKYKK